MIVKTLLDDVTVNGAGKSIYLSNQGRQGYGIFQVSYGGGTGNVTLQGRTSNKMPWHVLKTYTTDDGARVTLFPEMQCVVDTIGGGAAIRAEFAE